MLKMLFDIINGGLVGPANTVVYAFNIYHQLMSHLRNIENTKMQYYRNIRHMNARELAVSHRLMDDQLVSLYWNLGRCINALVKLPGNECLQEEATRFNYLNSEPEMPVESLSDTRIDQKMQFITKIVRFMLGDIESELRQYRGIEVSGDEDEPLLPIRRNNV